MIASFHHCFIIGTWVCSLINNPGMTYFWWIVRGAKPSQTPATAAENYRPRRQKKNRTSPDSPRHGEETKFLVFFGDYLYHCIAICLTETVLKMRKTIIVMACDGNNSLQKKWCDMHSSLNMSRPHLSMLGFTTAKSSHSILVWVKIGPACCGQ